VYGFPAYDLTLAAIIILGNLLLGMLLHYTVERVVIVAVVNVVLTLVIFRAIFGGKEIIARIREMIDRR
jgi:hypothetical protein